MLEWNLSKDGIGKSSTRSLQVEEERMLEVGSAGDVLGGVNFVDHSVTRPWDPQQLSQLCFQIMGLAAESALRPSGLICVSIEFSLRWMTLQKTVHVGVWRPATWDRDWPPWWDIYWIFISSCRCYPKDTPMREQPMNRVEERRTILLRQWEMMSLSEHGMTST